MKRMFLLSLLFSCLSNYLIGQTIEEYMKLAPIVNEIGETEEERILVFFEPGGISGTENLRLYNPTTFEEVLINNEKLEFKSNEILEAFYTPYTNDNYVYLKPENESTRQLGWYKINFNKETHILSLGNFIDSSVFELRRCPPVLNINNSHSLIVDGGYQKDSRKYYEEIKVLETGTRKIIWSESFEFDRKEFIGKWVFKNVYWVHDKWLFIENTPFTGSQKYATNHSLFNYETKAERSFAPEIIIGYGSGNIITTSEELVGITIQDPNKNIIFKDEKFDLVGMLRNSLSIKLISFAYFDNRYVYYTVYTGSSGNFPYCSVIIDTNTLQSYRTVGDEKKLLGIF